MGSNLTWDRHFNPKINFLPLSNGTSSQTLHVVSAFNSKKRIIEIGSVSPLTKLIHPHPNIQCKHTVDSLPLTPSTTATSPFPAQEPMGSTLPILTANPLCTGYQQGIRIGEEIFSLHRSVGDVSVFIACTIKDHNKLMSYFVRSASAWVEIIVFKIIRCN